MVRNARTELALELVMVPKDQLHREMVILTRRLHDMRKDIGHLVHALRVMADSGTHGGTKGFADVVSATRALSARGDEEE